MTLEVAFSVSGELFLSTCQSGRKLFVVGVKAGSARPPTRRISMPKYLLSAHTVALHCATNLTLRSSIEGIFSERNQNRPRSQRLVGTCIRL